MTILIVAHFIGLTVNSPIKAAFSHTFIVNIIGFLAIAAPSAGNFCSCTTGFRLTGNNIDYAADSITAVKGRSRALQHLNTFNIIHITYFGRLEYTRYRAVGVSSLSVYQNKNMAGTINI